MKGQTVAYLRVSSEDQNLERQTAATEGADKIFEEKISGSNKDRPRLQELIDYVRDGDTVQVYSIDRLARSLTDLNSIIDHLVQKGVTVKFISERLTFSLNSADPTDRLMLHVMGAFAEFERALIKKRQAEGISKAKARGVYNRNSEVIPPETWVTMQKELAAGKPLATVAREYGFKRATVYRYKNMKDSLNNLQA